MSPTEPACVTTLASNRMTGARHIAGEVPSLTGLRFVAAFCVAFAHGSGALLKIEDAPALKWLGIPAYFGMTLFFVLSGFVIYYNYRQLIDRGLSGVGRFIWARFSRLYPLFLFVVLIEVIFSRQLFNFATSPSTDFLAALSALPYYLTFSHSWLYSLSEGRPLIHAVGMNSSFTWSISAEWFFYLSYPFIALLVAKAGTPRVALICILLWSVLWVGFAWSLDGYSPAIDAWASAHFGSTAGVRTGYQESFVLWLNYFSPYLRIGEFILGCLVGRLFVLLEGRPVDALERRIGLSLLVVAIASVPVICYLSCFDTAPLLRGLPANYGLAPSIAVIIFVCARYPSAIAQVLNSRPFVVLGEASYSIYLFHFLIFMVVAAATGYAIPLTFWSVVYAGARLVSALALVMIVALGSYTFVELPSRRYLRKLLPAHTTLRQAAPAIGVVASPVALAIVLMAISSSLLNSGDSATDLRIESATYGGNCGAKSGNATRSVRMACSGKERCEYAVDVYALGDPAGGCAKSFTVTYVCRTGHRRTSEAPAEAGFGSRLVLDCSSAAGAGPGK